MAKRTLSLKAEFQKPYNPVPSDDSPELVDGVSTNYPKLKFPKNTDTNRLLEVVAELEKSERGQELLANAEKNNTWIGFGSSMMMAYGSYCEKQNRVLLNPRNHPARRVATLAHELRHAEQFNSYVDIDPEKNTVKSYLMGMFAIEADANAHSCLVAWDLKQQGDEMPWKALSQEYPHITKPFETEAEKGNVKDALSAAFKGWYDNMSIRGAYEVNYTRMLDQKYVSHSKDPEVLSKIISPEETVKRTCVYKNELYFNGNPKILEDKNHLSLGHETWWSCWRTYRSSSKFNFTEAEKEAHQKMGDIPKRDNNGEGFFEISPKQAQTILKKFKNQR